MHTLQNTVGYVCEGKQLGKKLHVYIIYLCGSSVIYSKNSIVSSESGTLNSVLCSSMHPKTEQLACFAQTFAMALELVHCCCLQKHNGSAVGGNENTFCAQRKQ